MPGERLLGLAQFAQRQFPAVLQFAGNIAVVRVDLVELALGQQRLVAQALDLLGLGAVEGLVRLVPASWACVQASNSAGVTAAKNASTTRASIGSAGSCWQIGSPCERCR